MLDKMGRRRTPNPKMREKIVEWRSLQNNYPTEFSRLQNYSCQQWTMENRVTTLAMIMGKTVTKNPRNKKNGVEHYAEKESYRDERESDGNGDLWTERLITI